MVRKENFILYMFIPTNYIFKYIKLCTYRSIYLGTYISFCWHSFSKISLYSCNFILSLTFFLSLTFIIFFSQSLGEPVCLDFELHKYFSPHFGGTGWDGVEYTPSPSPVRLLSLTFKVQSLKNKFL